MINEAMMVYYMCRALYDLLDDMRGAQSRSELHARYQEIRGFLRGMHCIAEAFNNDTSAEHLEDLNDEWLAMVDEERMKVFNDMSKNGGIVHD